MVEPFEERYKKWYEQYGPQLEFALATGAKTTEGAKQAVSTARQQAGKGVVGVDQYVEALRGAAAAPAQPAVPAATQALTSEVLRAVQAAKPKALSVPSIAEVPGQTVNLAPWLQAIGQGPGQVFTLEQLQQALARPLPEVPQARFATPEQLGQWIAQFQQAQEPWLQAATELARSEAARQLQNLQNQWAARGLLASGAAAAQEREAVADLGQRLAEVRTRALAESVNQALQAGQLSLDEAARLWDMAYRGRQADVENILAALGLQEQMRQNWLDQLARYWQAETGQSQWAQELGLSRRRQGWEEWLGTQQLNQQAMSDWLSRLLQAGGLAEEARQFERRMPLWEAELTGLLYGQPTLAARQFDWQRVLQEAGLTGMYQGQPTWERLLGEAQLTGMYQGRPTWERLLQEAGLTGYYQGRPTLERWWRSQQLAQARERASQRTALERLKESAWEKLAAGVPFADLTEGEKMAVVGYRGAEESAPTIEDDKAALKEALLRGATHVELAKKIDDAVNRGDITAGEGLQLKQYLYSIKLLRQGR